VQCSAVQCSAVQVYKNNNRFIVDPRFPRKFNGVIAYERVTERAEKRVAWRAYESHGSPISQFSFPIFPFFHFPFSQWNMESILAFMSTRTSAQVGEVSLQDRISLLRFVFPFEVYYRTTTPYVGHNPIIKRALVVEMVMYTRLDDDINYTVLMICLLPGTSGQYDSSSKLCHNALSLLECWEVPVSERRDPLCSIGCMVGAPYSPTKSPARSVSMDAYLRDPKICYDSQKQLQLPLMHPAAQQTLRQRAHDLYTQEPDTVVEMVKLYENPFCLRNSYHKDDAWRPILYDTLPECADVKIWDRVGTLVKMQDRGRLCTYLHPLVLDEWKRCFPAMSKISIYLHDTDHDLDKDGLRSLLCGGLADLWQLNAIDVCNEHGWISLEDLLRVSCNSPKLVARYCAGAPENGIRSIGHETSGAFLTKTRDEIYDALERNAWEQVHRVPILDTKGPIAHSHSHNGRVEVEAYVDKSMGTYHIRHSPNGLCPYPYPYPVQDYPFGVKLLMTCSKGSSVNGVLTPSGTTLVFAGTRIIRDADDTTPLHILALRHKLFFAKKLVDDDNVDSYLLAQDHGFCTYKEAADCILGTDSDSHESWQSTEHHMSLATYLFLSSHW
jgi:hypothetical protein